MSGSSASEPVRSFRLRPTEAPPGQLTRMPQLRLTVRRMMVVVAIAGLILGLGLWARRMVALSRRCEAKAASYAALEARCLASCAEIEEGSWRASDWLTIDVGNPDVKAVLREHFHQGLS